MVFVPATNVIQCNIRADYLNEQVENVLHFRIGQAPTAALVDFVAQNVRASWATNMLPNLAGDYIFREVYATDQSTQNGPVATVPQSPPASGQFPGPSLPGSVALCLTHRTPNRGRSFRGRTYICGLTEGQVVGNTVGQSAASGILGGFLTVIANLAAINATFVIVSRVSNGAPRAAAVVTEVTDTLLRDNSVDSQRRRLAGRGR